MALANVGDLLSRVGLNVLLVDFDFESPGLEAYFESFNSELLEASGLLDHVMNYKDMVRGPGSMTLGSGTTLPLEGIGSSAVKVTVPGDTRTGTLRLMTVGRREAGDVARYYKALVSLDWKDFYENWEGELYFRWLRHQFESQADVTLIDCRTGVTDTGRICCEQLADCVVLFCSAAAQQISGIEMMLRSLSHPRLKEVRGAPLISLVVPARFDIRSEAERAMRWRDCFSQRISPFLPAGISFDDMWSALIPFVPYYEFGASLVFGNERGMFEIEYAYRSLASLLCRVAPSEARMHAVENALQMTE